MVAVIDDAGHHVGDIQLMNSLASSLIRLQIADNRQTIHILKHFNQPPGIVERSIQMRPPFKDLFNFDEGGVKLFFQSLLTGKDLIRPQTGDKVDMFWTNLAHWSGMLWDGQGFAAEVYRRCKENSMYESCECWQLEGSG